MLTKNRQTSFVFASTKVTKTSLRSNYFMYFIILNSLLIIFFLLLICIGIKFKFWHYIVANGFGIIIAGFALFLDLMNYLSKLHISLLLLGLIVIFCLNIVYIFRDFKEEVTENAVKQFRKYVNYGSFTEHYKIIADEQLIKNEIEQFKNVPIPERLQALEMFKLGNRAYREEKYQEALEKYDISTSWIKTSIGFLNQSGVLLKLGQYEDALVMAEKAAEIQTSFYEAYLNQGAAFEKLKQLDEALSKYKSACSASPDEYEVWYCCANIYYKMNRPEEAIEYYDRTLNLYGRIYEPWYYKGICLQKTGKEVEALRCFEQVIKLNSDYSYAYYRSGNILNRLNRNDEALFNFEKAIKINSNFMEAWNNYGVVLNKLGRINDAIRCYKRAIKINPGYFEAWLNLGMAHDTLNKYKKAYKSYCKFLEIAPSDMEKRIHIIKKRVEELKNRYKIKSKVKKSKPVTPQKTVSKDVAFTD